MKGVLNLKYIFTVRKTGQIEIEAESMEAILKSLEDDAGDMDVTWDEDFEIIDIKKEVG